MMMKPTIDELLEQLEEAREEGRVADPDSLCSDWPELLEPLRHHWQRILQFEEKFGDSPPEQSSNETHRESTAEVHRKMIESIETLEGMRLVMQTELHLDRFHDRGGLGDVYRVRDGDLSREVAVKLLRADRKDDANLEDFHREAQIIGRMNHPGVVAIHGTGETMDGRPFYTMPFLEGGNFRSRINAYHRDNPGALVDDQKEFRDLLYRLVAVCKTIAYAHSRGIVHRDLKAENVLLGKYGETLVIDWGCASQFRRDHRHRVFGERTLELSGVSGTNSSGGLTLRYASPEQFHSRTPIGPESDIYSLGAILYLLVTGKSPLEDELDERVRSLVLRGQIPPAESIKSGVPKSLSAICQKAMALEPRDRYDNALKMADDIERYLADEPTTVCRQSLGMKLTRVVRRNRTASMIMIGTLLISSLLLSLAYHNQRQHAQRSEASAQHRLKMAASMVSSVGGFEISRRLSLLEVEAAQASLVEAMRHIEQNPTDKDLWETPQSLLYQFKVELEASGLRVDSVFLNDPRGTQIARAPKDVSIGGNFAYRHYFHGQQHDLDQESMEYKDTPPPPAAFPVISNAFVSTNRLKDGSPGIKIALSVPIIDRQRSPSHVVGRLSMTLRIDELAIFDSLRGLPLNAVLVETRDYPWGSGKATGLILDRFSPDELEPPSPLHRIDRRVSSDTQAKDAMPRLQTTSMDRLFSSDNSAAALVKDFFDPQIAPQAAEVVCADLLLPYRSDLPTGWKLIFIDAKDSKF